MLLIADALADWLCYGMGVYSKHVYIYIYIYGSTNFVQQPKQRLMYNLLRPLMLPLPS